MKAKKVWILTTVSEPDSNGADMVIFDRNNPVQNP
jgi:hypothetical protein